MFSEAYSKTNNGFNNLQILDYQKNEKNCLHLLDTYLKINNEISYLPRKLTYAILSFAKQLAIICGPLVKRLRRSPLKAESWVRFP